ncbi:hypothetical protein BD289DRAFT_442925 [Coniella lustricola]|uniref:Uncharacterized protein n=1 Tax=Coniella lustricola TaxID=2025994 RepID=A0A2T2ZXP1_9PEZI|nr:hypothetical protein BD289DRAFT_442925 [Coniella lustricola]
MMPRSATTRIQVLERAAPVVQPPASSTELSSWMPATLRPLRPPSVSPLSRFHSRKSSVARRTTERSSRCLSSATSEFISPALAPRSQSTGCPRVTSSSSSSRRRASTFTNCLPTPRLRPASRPLALLVPARTTMPSTLRTRCSASDPWLSWSAMWLLSLVLASILRSNSAHSAFLHSLHSL